MVSRTFLTPPALTDQLGESARGTIVVQNINEELKSLVHVNENQDLGTGGKIRELERRLRRPVLTANQIVFWAALRAARVTAKVTQYGSLFGKG